MSKTVVVFNRPLEETLKAKLEQHFEVADYSHLKDPSEDPGFLEALGRAEGAIGSSLKFGQALIDRAPNLKVVSSISVGVDNFDVEALSRRGILLCHTPDVLTETTADTGFALIMATARRVVELADWVRDGQWKESLTPARFGVDVQGATLGVVGMGRIGAAIARRGKFGFNMRVLYHNRSRNQEYEGEIGVEYCELDALLEQSDFVCVTVPFSKQTEKMFGKREFELMGPKTIFVNIARGGVVDEPALIEALEQGTIRAAGLDVFVKEPIPADNPLPRMRNVVALPHIGSATDATRYAMAELAVDNLVRGLAGERPKAPYNWKDLDRD
ncbi:2-hydroxyacid dehydrogenase [Halotalea alkalilenta]|uniref:Bifunctional glyoxylate/hydroxypyruvate reductase B n=1 Tax=Halotalea alkalilenta TaxID=376489 RepID=A0A172YH51_9GAMM|nr:D-glycerate dehydrogenase [Halotalea alkalilenta]ANF58590.1 bifunctional glyoxylate/hydroxypyruvate reductase B [Halotalea alkalilenta]